MAWKVDPAHTRIDFSVRHLMITHVRGEFQDFTGEVSFDPDNPAATSINVEIKAVSINTGEQTRDNHLRSADFFDVEKHPLITYKSTSVEVLDSTHAKLTGDLTIRGVTHPFTLDVTYYGQEKDPYGRTSAGFEATGEIKRTDWGLNWNQALESGGVLVGEEVTIHLAVELLKEEEAVPAS